PVKTQKWFTPMAAALERVPAVLLIDRDGVSTLHCRHVNAKDPLVPVLVGNYGERRRIAVIDNGSTRGEDGGDPLMGYLGWNIDLNVKPLMRRLVPVGVTKPKVWYASCGVPDFIAQ